MEDVVFLERLKTVLANFRSEDTKNYALSLLRFLNNRAPKMVRLKDVQNALVGDVIKYESQFFRIIKVLTEEHLIHGFVDTESREPGKKPVYIRLRERHPDYFFDTRDDLLSKRYAELAAAKELLKDCGVEDPDTAVQNKVNEMYGVTVEPDDGTSEEDPRMKAIRERMERDKNPS